MKPLDDRAFADAVPVPTAPLRSRTPALMAKLDRRDEHLRAAADELFPGAFDTVAGDGLNCALSRYYTTAWQFERSVETCPHGTGTLKAYCWAILKAYPVPLAARTIRRIISTRGQRSGPNSHRRSGNNERS